MTDETKPQPPASIRLKEAIDDLRRNDDLRDVKFWYVGGTGSDASSEALAEEVLEILDVYKNERFKPLEDDLRP